MENSKELEIFRSAPVGQAVLKNALPAMAAMLMVLIYNLADTFFIGQTHDAYQVAAVSMATPVFLIFMAIGTVFGIGGTSVISRALGEDRKEYAKSVCAFCLWSCVVVGVIMAAGFLIFMDQILLAMGTSNDTRDFVRTYLTVVAYSGPFVLIANCYSNVVRAEGQPGKAMMGQLLGNLLNVILDPILILGFGWGIAGAAIATVIGNVFGGGYYLLYYVRGKSILGIHPKALTTGNKVCFAVLSIGIPASLGPLLMSVSQIVMNNQMAAFDDLAVAGIGVASKITMMTGMICIGFGQGVQPLLGYCIGARLMERFKKVMQCSLIYALAISGGMTLFCYLFTNYLVSAFLTQEAAFAYAVHFLRIMLVTGSLFGVFYVLSNALQAAGAAKEALIINLSRQGIIYIPALFILKAIIGMDGLIWAQPTADLLSTLLVVLLYAKTINRLMQNSKDSV